MHQGRVTFNDLMDVLGSLAFYNFHSVQVLSILEETVVLIWNKPRNQRSLQEQIIGCLGFGFLMQLTSSGPHFDRLQKTFSAGLGGGFFRAGLYDYAFDCKTRTGALDRSFWKMARGRFGWVEPAWLLEDNLCLAYDFQLERFYTVTPRSFAAVEMGSISCEIGAHERYCVTYRVWNGLTGELDRFRMAITQHQWKSLENALESRG